MDKLNPITADNDAIEAALAHAHVPSLINALVHLTGDASLIRGDIRPTSQMFGDPQGGISDAHQAAVRERALAELAAYRDAGCPALAPPSPALVKEMVDFVVGKELDASYGDFLMSELKVFDEDPYRVSFDDLPEARKGDFHVVVVGAGMSGILTAIRLKQAGIGYTVVDKNKSVGGTWFENRYPGCRVDSPNHTYSYSFAPNDWPQHFSRQEVLLDYFQRIATDFGILDNVRLSTEVTEARYADGRWLVSVSGPKGDDVIEANAIVSAVGQLNRPKLPAIDGVGSFAGPAFHTAQWESEHDLAGKRVIVIGTGASAFQSVPEIAQVADQVTVFQRTPPWVAPRAEYHDYIEDGKHWLLNHVPFYAKWFRFWMFWTTAEGLLAMVRRDPAWNDTDRSVSEANDQLRAMLTANVEKMVGDDPALYDKCVPAYPPAGKRMLVDNGHWFRALKRDNVELVTDPIAAIEPTGVRTESGRHVDGDVLIYATGFHASRILFPMKIYGKDGVELREHWGADPRAYLGIVMPGFPNLFCCYGPNTNIVVNGSIIFFSECEVRYIMGCLKLLLQDDKAWMDCRPDVHEAYNRKIDAGNADMAWGSPNVSSWYKNENGRVTQNWPFSLIEFWNQTRAPNAADYELA